MKAFAALCAAAISCACPGTSKAPLDFAGDSRPEAFEELNKELQKDKEVQK